MLCFFHFRTGGGEGIRGEGEGSPKLTQPGSGARGGREGASHHLHHQAPGTRHTRLTRLTSPILSTSPAIFSSSFYSSPSTRPPPPGPPGPPTTAWPPPPPVGRLCVAPTGCPGDCGKQHPPPPLEEGELKVLSSLNNLRRLLCPPPTV